MYNGAGLLASALGDRKIMLWNPTNSQLLRTLLGHSDWIYGIAFNSKSLLAGCASADKTMRVWNVRSGQQITVLRRHAGAVGSVAFGQDDSMASGSWDYTVKLWT